MIDMNKESQIYYIDKSTVNEFEKIINGCFLEDSEDHEVMYHLTFSFGDKIEVDIDVCNGASEELINPYVYVQAIKNGVYFFEQIKRSLVGIHTVIDRELDFIYEIEIRIKE